MAHATNRSTSEMTRYESIKGTDLRLAIDDKIVSLPCLAGDDVRRHTGDICVEIKEGKLYSAEWGDELQVDAPGDNLLGWGSFDGPGVNIGNGIWYVTVPEAVIEHLCKHHSLHRPVAA